MRLQYILLFLCYSYRCTAVVLYYFNPCHLIVLKSRFIAIFDNIEVVIKLRSSIKFINLLIYDIFNSIIWMKDSHELVILTQLLSTPKVVLTSSLLIVPIIAPPPYSHFHNSSQPRTQTFPIPIVVVSAHLRYSLKYRMPPWGSSRKTLTTVFTAETPSCTSRTNCPCSSRLWLVA